MKKVFIIIIILLIITIGISVYFRGTPFTNSCWPSVCKTLVEENKTVKIEENKTIKNEENKTITPENRGQVRDEMRLAGCPDQLIINKMPTIIDPDTKSDGKSTQQNSYYIKDGARVEISEYDSIWVSANCEVPTEVVY